MRTGRRPVSRAERAGLCQLIERNNATLGDILDVFQDRAYRNRIVGFHFGGHANSLQLMMESESTMDDSMTSGSTGASL